MSVLIDTEATSLSGPTHSTITIKQKPQTDARFHFPLLHFCEYHMYMINYLTLPDDATNHIPILRIIKISYQYGSVFCNSRAL